MRTRFIQNDIIAYLQDYRKHTMQDLCNELNISRSTCIRHLNDLSMYYNIQTFVGRYNGGVKLVYVSVLYFLIFTLLRENNGKFL